MLRLLVVPLTLTLAAPAVAVDYAMPTGPVTITIRKQGKRTFFAGPKRVSRLARLTVVNRTGEPHTFSLVRAAAVPRTKAQRKACGDGLCGRIARAHRFDRQSLKVKRRTVDAGLVGWDRPFGKTPGDTWYVDRRGRRQTRRVSAPVGTVLTYFDATHPNASGTIRVDQ